MLGAVNGVSIETLAHTYPFECLGNLSLELYPILRGGSGVENWDFRVLTIHGGDGNGSRLNGGKEFVERVLEGFLRVPYSIPGICRNKEALLIGEKGTPLRVGTEDQMIKGIFEGGVPG